MNRSWLKQMKSMNKSLRLGSDKVLGGCVYMCKCMGLMIMPHEQKQEDEFMYNDMIELIVSYSFISLVYYYK